MARQRPRPTLVLAFLLARGLAAIAEDGLAPEVSPFRAVQEALARDDAGTVRRLLDAIASPKPGDSSHRSVASAKALLSVALEAREERPSRYLHVAAAYPDRLEGLAALVAALSLVEEAYAIGEPPLSADRLEELRDLARSIFPAIEASHADDDLVRLAAELLARIDCGGTDERHAEIVVAGGARLPVPQPLAEEVSVALFGGEGRSVASIAEDGLALSPVFRVDVAPSTDGPTLLPPATPGDYMIDVRSASRGWRRLRRVRASDLDVSVRTVAGGLVALATIGGRPAAGVECVLTNRWSGDLLAKEPTDGTGLARFSLPVELARASLLLAVRVEPPNGGGEHRADVACSLPDPQEKRPRLSAHIVVDRPIYRPGEVVRGRVVVRRHDARPGSAAPLSERDLKIEYRSGSGPTRTLAARLDGFGVAPFSIPIRASDALGPLAIEVVLPLREEESFAGESRSDERGRHVALLSEWPARVVEFRRPPLLLDVTAPDEWRRGDADPEIAVSAQFPTGVPAAGLEGVARASVGSVRDARALALDAAGRARVRLALGEMTLSPGAAALASVAIEIAAPDGQTIRESRSIRIAHGPEARAAPARAAPLSIACPEGRVAIGSPAEIAIAGSPRSEVFLTVSSEAIFDARVVTLDDEGRARVALVAAAEWYPEVVVEVQSRDGESAGRIRVERPESRLEVRFASERAAYGPGDEARFSFDVRDGAGRPAEATLAVSVVDESLFLLARDATRDPLESLRPLASAARPYRFASPRAASPLLVIGEMLERGRVARPEPHWLFDKAMGLGGGAGGAYGGRTGGSAGRERSDFRATAFFAPNVRTGTDGRADVAFRFPDDLATWRVTIVAVDARGGAGLVRESVRTEKPLSVEPVLPRVLRGGDALVAKAMIADRTGASRAVALRAAGSNGIDVSSAPAAFETAPSRAVAMPLALAAAAEGSARLTLDLALESGEPVDRVVKELPVLSPDAIRETFDSAVVSGRAVLEPPDVEGAARRGVRVSLIGETDGLLKRASEYLGAYPHGCAEQTASRLVPVLVALRARLGGEAGPLSPEQAHRLEVGFARLRDLKSDDGGFGWWERANECDPFATAAVFRALALAREAGLDLEPYGLAVAADAPALARIDAEPLVAALAGDDAQKRPRAAAEADLLAAALLLFPDSETLRAKARAVVENAGRIPSGLAARAARALFLAGDRAAAVRALDVLAETGPSGDVTGPDESPVARAAALLDLVLAARPEDDLRARLVAEIARRSRGGGRLDHTSATAAALVALARERASRPRVPEEGGAAVVLIEGDVPGERIEVREGDDGFPDVELAPGTRRVVVTSAPPSRTIVATAAARFAEPADGAAALSEGISVSRRLEPEGTFSEGGLIEAVVDVAAPRGLTYVLVECPIPAGCEVIPARGRLEVRDDRVAIGLSRLDDEGRATVRFRMLAAMEGDVLFPPATAEAMYAPELRGRSRGERIAIGPRRPDPEAAAAVALLGEKAAERTLADLESALSATDDPRGVLRSLGEFPDEAAATRALSAAPRLLGARLLDSDVAEAWLGALGRRAEGLLAGASLSGVLDATGVARPAALKRLAAALRASPIAGDVANRFASADEGSDDSRLAALAIVESSVFPGGASAVEIATRLLDSEFAAERVEAMVNPWPEWRGSRAHVILAVPARDAIDGLIRPEGVAVGTGIDERTLDRVLRLARVSFGAWRSLRPPLREKFSPVLESLLALGNWPGKGACAPASFARFRRSLESLRAGALETLVSERDVTDLAAWRVALGGDAAAADVARGLDLIVELGADVARHVLDRSRHVRSDARVRARLLAIVARGPFSLRDRAFAALGRDDRASVPDGVLLDAASRDRDEGWAVAEILRRGDRAAVETLVRHVPRSASTSLRRSVALDAPSAIVGEILAPAEIASSLFCDLDPRNDRHRAARERLVMLLVESDADVAGLLAAARDLRERYALLRAAAARGLETAPFDDAGDPAAARWRTLLRARGGDASAAEDVRRWLADETMPEIERVDVFFALEPHASAFDLRNVPADSLDPAVVARVLERGPADAIASLLLDPKIRTDARRTLADAAPASSLREALWPRLAAAGAGSAVEALESLDRREGLAEEAARILLDHGHAYARSTAARFLFRATGEPVTYRTDVALAVVGPDGPLESLAAARTRARRNGLAAIAGDRETLARFGLCVGGR